MKEKVCVIGAGPSGIIAAGFAGSLEKDVTLIEKNEKIGKKLFITGKGRCNITNNSPIEDFFDNILTNKNFLYSGLYSFSNEDILNLLESYGLKVKVERGNRVFPESNKSSDVIKVLNQFLTDNNVNLKLNTNIKDIEKVGDKFLIKTDKNVIMTFDKLIIATGGKSYPTTGSIGDGYKFAEKLGHKIIKIKPSLIPIEIKEESIKTLQGLSLRNVSISAYVDNKVIYDEFGEMIFTHYGISGPIIIPMSNYLSKYINISKEILIYLDLKPALSMKKLDDRLLRDFQQYNNKQLKNAFDDLLPQRLISYVIDLTEIDPEKLVHQITKEERMKILENIKKLPMTFKSFRPIEEAIITSGGVCTKEINSSTMESKLVEGLFFCGEVIDVDGLTGGYNLQIAYSTGYLAGINV